MKVEIYFNLHKRLFSIRERHGKVIAHKKWVGLVRPTFIVQQGGREKVLRDKSKNVHAFVRPESIWGDSSTTDTYLLSKANGVPDFDQTLTDYTTVRYNPYKYTSFVDENEDPIFEADVGFMYLDKQNKPVIKVASLDQAEQILET